MSIIIERTITIKDDKATLDRPLYLYVGDGDITCLFDIKEKEKTARFGTIDKTTNSITNQASYGEVRIYKPAPGSDSASRLVFTNRAEIIDNKLQVTFSYKNIDDFSEAGVHKLQIHLYDDDDSERNRYTIPSIDLYVLLPVGSDNNTINEAIAGYSLLDRAGEEVPTFYYDEEGNYNYNKTEWQTGDIITSNKLNKIEDALYEINAADANFVTNDDFTTALADKADAAHRHPTSDITGLARVATTGSYNDLSNKPNMSGYATKDDLQNINIPNIPTRTSQLTNDSGFITSANVPTKTSQLTNDSGFITNINMPTIPTKTSQLTNDSNFITSIPSYYITESELEDEFNGRSYASESFVTRKIAEAQLSPGDGSGVDLSGFATKDDLNNKADKSAIPTLTSQLTNNSGFITSIPFYYVTEAYLRDNNYTTTSYVDSAIESAQLGGSDVDLSGYALKSEIPTVPINVSAFINDKGYMTETEVDDKINNAQIDVDLSNYPTYDDMNSALAYKANDNHLHDDRYVQKNEIPTNVSSFTNDAGYITSNTITEIRIVEELPASEAQEPGVLYIVKE